MIDNQERSLPHRRVEGILDKMGISYLSENTEFHPYKLDVYLPEWHLNVEVDGPQHSKNKDQVRDQFLKYTYGIETLRLKTSKGFTTQQIQDNIKDFIVEHSETSQDRKQLWLTIR